tara:strand:+ start:25 stop:432 length:408 start_codon:yes stop_codon:yes gene_type:complete
VGQQTNLLCLVQRYMQLLGVMGKEHQIIQEAVAVVLLWQVLIQMEMLLVMVVLDNYFLTLLLMGQILDTLAEAEAVLTIVLMQVVLVLVVLVVVVLAEKLQQGIHILVLLIQAVAVVPVVILLLPPILVLVVLVL